MVWNIDLFGIISGKKKPIEQKHTNCGGSKQTTFYVAQNLQQCLKEPVTCPCPQLYQSRPHPTARFPYNSINVILQYRPTPSSWSHSSIFSRQTLYTFLRNCREFKKLTSPFLYRDRTAKNSKHGFKQILTALPLKSSQPNFERLYIFLRPKQVWAKPSR
jgi:hypothetical protein